MGWISLHYKNCRTRAGQLREHVLLGGQERQVPLDGPCRRMRFLVEWILAPGDLIRVAINQSVPQALMFCWCEICQWPSGETRATFITSSESGWRQRKEVWAQTALFFFGGGDCGLWDIETETFLIFFGWQKNFEKLHQIHVVDKLHFTDLINIKEEIPNKMKLYQSICYFSSWGHISCRHRSPSGLFFNSCTYFCKTPVASSKEKCSCF